MNWNEWKKWKLVLADSYKESQFLWAILIDCGLISINTTTITLAAPTFVQCQFRKFPHLLTDLKTIAIRHLGNVHINITNTAPDPIEAPSLVLIDAENLRRQQEEAIDEAMNNESIRSIVKIFNGKILGVEVHGI